MPDQRQVVGALGLGSNLGDRADHIATALNLIEQKRAARVLSASSLWLTPPWGVIDQPAFLNACALVETGLSPSQLLSAVKSIEAEMGRRSGQRWGPRLIDIDILFYGDTAVMEPGLLIPHPHLFERAFVLAPLSEIAGDRFVGEVRVRDALTKVDFTGLHIVGPCPIRLRDRNE